MVGAWLSAAVYTVWALAAPAQEQAPAPALIEVPYACLGTGEYKGALATRAVLTAIERGYRCIDTAHEYGNQLAIGNGIRQALANASNKVARDDLFVITKVEGGLAANITSERLHADAALLRIGPPDLVLLHYPKASPPLSFAETTREQWRAIATFVQSGGAKHGGVSQFCTQAFAALDADPTLTYRPRLNQVGLHVGMGDDPQGVVAECSRRGDMALMAYSPLSEADPALLNGTLERQLAAKYSVSPAQVALRWLYQRGIPYAVAATNPVYQAENIGILGFQLTATEMAQLSSLTEPAGCPFWPGSACWAMTCNRTGPADGHAATSGADARLAMVPVPTSLAR